MRNSVRWENKIIIWKKCNYEMKIKMDISCIGRLCKYFEERIVCLFKCLSDVCLIFVV